LSRIQGLKKDFRPILQNRRNSESSLRPASPSPKTGALSKSPVLNERFNKYRSSTARSKCGIGPPAPAQKLNRTASETNTACEELVHTQIYTENSNTESGGEHSPRFYTEDTRTLISSRSETDCKIIDSEEEVTQNVSFLEYSKAQISTDDTQCYHSVPAPSILINFPEHQPLYPGQTVPISNSSQPCATLPLSKPFVEIGPATITEYTPMKKPAIHILSQKPILNSVKYPRVPRFKQVNLEELAKVYQLPELSESSFVPISQMTDDRLITTSDLFRTHEEELSHSNSFDYSDSQSSPDYVDSARLLEKNNMIYKGEVFSLSPSRASSTMRSMDMSSCINLVPTDEETAEHLRRSSFLSNVSMFTEVENVLSFDEFMSQISPKNSFSKTYLPFKANLVNKSTLSKAATISQQPSKTSNHSQKLDINKIKQVALEKERNLQMRKDAATKLQALIRGFLAKQKFKQLLSRRNERILIYRLDKIMSRIQQSFAIQRIVKACTVTYT